MNSISNRISKLKVKIFILYYSSRLSIQVMMLDQISKFLCLKYLKSKPLMMASPIRFLDLVYTWNYGISFGWFRKYYQYSNYFFMILNSVVIFYLWYLLANCKSVISFRGYSLIIGGALGNLVDRFFRGAVFDFIYPHYEGYGLFVCNLADCFISLGIAFIVYDHLKLLKSSKRSN